VLHALSAAAMASRGRERIQGVPNITFDKEGSSSDL